MEDSAPRTPLVFILSPGVDPTSALLQLAEHTGMAQRFHALSLGQGQAPIAARLLREGVVQGQCLPSSSAPNHGPGLTVHQLPPVTLLSLQLPLLQKALGVGTSALGPSP